MASPEISHVTKKAAVLFRDAMVSWVTDTLVSTLPPSLPYSPMLSLSWDSVLAKALARKEIRLRETSTWVPICQGAVGGHRTLSQGDALRIRHGLSPAQRAGTHTPDKSQAKRPTTVAQDSRDKKPTP